MAVKKLDKKNAEAKARPGKSPNQVARAILEEAAGPADDPARLFHGFVQHASGSTYGYNGRYWEPVGDATLRAIAFEADTRMNHGATASKRRSEIIDFIKASSHKFDLEFARVADHEVPCLNGVVDVLTGALRPHRREDYLDSVLPVRFDPDAKCGELEQTLIDWFGDVDPGGRDEALQEFAGYVALPHAKFKKALFLQGKGNTGKSLFIKLMRKFVGEKFTCSLSVEDMDDPVARWVIKHKRLNVMTELTADAMIKDGGFKTLVSTEEPIPINGKYEQPISYVPVAKHIIAANDLPRITDRTEATVDRLLVVPFDRVFAPHEQDETLFDRLTTQEALSATLNWALIGARRLIARRGQFVPVPAAAELVKAVREEANPFVAFRDHLLIEDASASIPFDDLTERFNQWNKGGRKIDNRAMGKLVRGAGIEPGQFRTENGGKAKGLKGWRFRDRQDGDVPPSEAPL